MLINAVLSKLVEAGVVLSVDRVFDPGLPLAAEAYVLRFEHATITVSVNADDDTVDVVEGERVAPNQSRAAAEVVWAATVGRPVRWAWFLTNQQGYRDGIQLDWAHPGEPRGVCLQLIAVASALKIRRVESD